MGNMNREKNRAVWFDVPVTDLDRAITFYEAVLGVRVFKENNGQTDFGVIDHEDGNGGCLVPGLNPITSEAGILLYLNVHGRIRDAVEQVKSHDGQVVQDVHSIGPHGFRAIILDSEGNRLALHSDSDE